MGFFLLSAFRTEALSLHEHDSFRELDPILARAKSKRWEQSSVDPFHHHAPLDHQAISELRDRDEGLIVRVEIGNAPPAAARTAPFFGLTTIRRGLGRWNGETFRRQCKRGHEGLAIAPGLFTLSAAARVSSLMPGPPHRVAAVSFTLRRTLLAEAQHNAA